ncbi:MAG: glycosyltransferase [Alphaproteobacteria bacterium]|nr:glycosyltransferase [Alphaproteobacteria bacterium]
MSQQPKVYVGYDSREDVAWQVCRHSLLRHASRDIGVFPLRQTMLRELGLYTRAVETGASTEFTLTRFLTPYLAAHEGWSVFVDCDFLFTADIFALLDTLDATKAIHVVKHDYTPRQSIKMDGKAQAVYPRKNWSSFIVFNGAHDRVKALTPELVNSAPPAFLHRFSWVPDDEAIGAVPLEWNFLVGEYDKTPRPPAAIHYTNGGPWFDNCRDVDYADLWNAEHDLVLAGRRA